MLASKVVATYRELFDLDRHVEDRECRLRRDAMVGALREEFGSTATFVPPAGGLFLWIELPAGVSARELLPVALRRGVAFPPGDAFFPDGGHPNTLRLAVSDSRPERIAEGIRRLESAFHEMRSRMSSETAAGAVV